MDETRKNKSSLRPSQQIWLLILAGGGLAVFQRAESLIAIGHPRSALSLYAAWRLLKGEVPYKSVWYDRFPGAILFDSAALAIHNSLVSILILELLAVVAAAILLHRALVGFRVPSVEAGVAAGWFGAAALAATALGGANEPAVLALPFIAGFLYYLRSAAGHGREFTTYLAGLLGGAAACFLGREWLLLFVGLLAIRRHASTFFLGFITLPAIFTVGMIATDAIEPFGRSVFGYGWAAFAAGGWRPSFEGGAVALALLAGTLTPLALILFPARERPADEKSYAATLRKAAGVWALLEAAALFFSGPAAPSSVLPLMVPLTFLLGDRTQLESAGGKPGLHARAAFVLVFVSFACIAVKAHGPFSAEAKREERSELWHPRLVAEMVSRNSIPSDHVFVWGDSSLTYVLSRRASPSACATTRPLFTRGYTKRAVPELIDDLLDNPPELIVLETSLLPEGFREKMPPLPWLEIGPPQRPLFRYLQKLVREEYRILTVNYGVVVCIRNGSNKSNAGAAAEKKAR